MCVPDSVSGAVHLEQHLPQPWCGGGSWRTDPSAGGDGRRSGPCLCRAVGGNGSNVQLHSGQSAVSSLPSLQDALVASASSELAQPLASGLDDDVRRRTCNDASDPLFCMALEQELVLCPRRHGPLVPRGCAQERCLGASVLEGSPLRLAAGVAGDLRQQSVGVGAGQR